MKRLVWPSAALVTLSVASAWACATPPLATTSSDTPPASATDPIVGGRDGLSVDLRLDRDFVEPGGTIEIEVIVHNHRQTPAIIAVGLCGAPASVHVDAPVPWQPSGIAWDGIAGAFKEFALGRGLGPGMVPASQALRIDARSDVCPDAFGELVLDPGESTAGKLAWTAELVGDVPVLPGDVPIVVEVAYDRPDPLPRPRCDPICASTVVIWKGLSAEGRIRIDGEAPRIVTGGEAIDAMLADARFADWLAQMPPATWSGANLFLQSWPEGGGIVPPGPSWEVDLFREIGVGRNWAIGFVDPFSAEVRSIEFCDIPCDR